MQSVSSLRVPLAILLLLTLALGLLRGDAAPAAAQTAGRFFTDTGFTIADDAFWDYFQHRGGVDTFGQPISRKFLFLGTEVQFFQRLVMQKQGNGSVSTLNLLDTGLMPVTRINGSTFPAPDQGLISKTPPPSDPDYGTKIGQFAQEAAPDHWEGLNVNFFQTFASVVNLQDAFPDGNGDAGLLPLLDLEIWGAPTSAPARDPANQDFVYQRFQRVVAHYDKGCDCTRTLLLADWFKSVLTGRNLPPDLDEEMHGSPFYRQYDLTKSNAVARPNQLVATNMLYAFEREDRPIPNVPASAATTQPTAAANGNDNAAATPTASASPTPGPDLGGATVQSSELAQDPVSRHWIGFGEVKNVSSRTVDVYAKMNIFNTQDEVMAIQEQKLGVAPLSPGQVGTFRIDFGKLDAGVDHQTTEVRSDVPATAPVTGLKTSDKQSAHDKSHFVVSGLVQNRSGDDVQNVRIGVSFYSKKQELLDVWEGSPVFDSIGDDKDVEFEASTSLADPGQVDNYAVYLVGFRGHPSPKLEDKIAKVAHTSIQADGGTTHVRGELTSDSDNDALDMRVAVILYDQNNHVVGAVSAPPLPTRVRPQATVPFLVDLPTPPGGYDHVDYRVLGQRYSDSDTWPQTLKVTGKKLERHGSGWRATGTLKNSSSRTLHNPYVVVTFYDSGGLVTDFETTDLGTQDMRKGDSLDFDVDTKATNVDSISVSGYASR